MPGVVCHGQKDVRVEGLSERPLGADEVRVAVAYGGICGSDLLYYHRGAVGDFRVREFVQLIVSGEVDVSGTLSGTYPIVVKLHLALNS